MAPVAEAECGKPGEWGGEEVVGMGGAVRGGGLRRGERGTSECGGLEKIGTSV